ncbi:MAG: MBL fold metallo-hydrolase, partial [Duncaniella sp.]|uniref:MBL fold metallo-hydrolase n=1 Tax=Duncaniella sp. TaxID=2518496 RepID=UPI0023C5E211
MAHSRKPSRLPMPGLFDSLEDFSENSESDFCIIPDEKMSEIARKYRREQPVIDELPSFQASDRIFFMSFGSGSSGNCSYIGDREGGFLIDAGVEVARVVDGLRRNGISMDRVAGICLTHDHGDHIRDVYPLLRRYRHLRVFCTPKTLNGILRRHNVSRRIKDYHSPVYKEFPFRIGNFEVTPFEVMHDGADNAGFFITNGDCRFAIATDLGCISERVDHYMRQANYIVIEANYDLNMLREGRYPEYLKARIEAPNGHLDNRVAAEFLAGIYTQQLRNIFLCHLSNDNNTPDRALRAVSSALAGVGVTRFGNGMINLKDT